MVVTCWRPCRTICDEIKAFFLGATTQLTDDSIVFGKAWDSRHQLVTKASGQVRLRITVIQRFFGDQHVDGSS
eukprot:5582707-Ditylum_brightwellii.AAC.1